VPARAVLPQAYEMFATLVSGDPLSRPPWGCVATPSLALDYLGLSPQVLWSYTLRRQGPEVEKDAKRLYRGVGKRNLYRYEAVLSVPVAGGSRAGAGLGRSPFCRARSAGPLEQSGRLAWAAGIREKGIGSTGTNVNPKHFCLALPLGGISAP
jgi:hypothetical protein